MQVELWLMGLSWLITPITMVYGTYNYSIHGVYKPTYNWGGPHCMYLLYYTLGKCHTSLVIVHPDNHG